MHVLRGLLQNGVRRGSDKVVGGCCKPVNRRGAFAGFLKSTGASHYGRAEIQVSRVFPSTLEQVEIGYIHVEFLVIYRYQVSRSGGDSVIAGDRLKTRRLRL